MMVMLDEMLSSGLRNQQERLKGQLSFFELGNVSGFQEINLRKIPTVKEWPHSQLLAFEKEMLGFYISGHPLARFSKQIKRFSQVNIQELTNFKDGDPVSLVGLIDKIKHTFTRDEEKMAILKLEDLVGSIEVLVFPNTFKQVYKVIQPSNVVLVKGRLDLKKEIPKIIAQDIISIENVYKLINAIKLDISEIKENLFIILKQRLEMSPGKVPVYLNLYSPSKNKMQLVVGENLFVNPTAELIQDIESILGEEKVSLVF
jgi:DNA polymerase-3 subunit alpha